MRRISRNAASVSLEDYTPVLKGLLGSGKRTVRAVWTKCV
jgi:hypothetical protein